VENVEKKIKKISIYESFLYLFFDVFLFEIFHQIRLDKKRRIFYFETTKQRQKFPIKKNQPKEQIHQKKNNGTQIEINKFEKVTKKIVIYIQGVSTVNC
jgi:hypothetical protein